MERLKRYIEENYEGDVNWLIENAKDLCSFEGRPYKEFLVDRFNDMYELTDSELLNYQNDDDNSYDYIYSMDELDEILEGTEYFDVIKMAIYGDFNPNHNWFKFDGYGNLKSIDRISDEVDYDYIVERAIESGEYDEINELIENKDALIEISQILIDRYGY